MAKVISYKFLSSEINRGTDEKPVFERVFQNAEIFCKNESDFASNYPIAEKEAVGEIIVEGAFEEEEPTEKDRIAQLEEALELLLSGVTE